MGQGELKMLISRDLFAGLCTRQELMHFFGSAERHWQGSTALFEYDYGMTGKASASPQQ